MAITAITYPLSLPSTPAPVSSRMRLDYFVSVDQSEFTGAQESQDWGGRLWYLDFTLPPMTRAQADDWIAVVHKLRGRKGYFLAGDWDRRTARGTWGTPLVKGGSQVGNTLDIDGVGAGTTRKAGDFFALGNRLYQLVVDDTADGSGNATIQFEPDLRSSPADNAPLTVSSPKGLFRLLANSTPWDTDPNGIHAMSFSAMEYLT